MGIKIYFPEPVPPDSRLHPGQARRLADESGPMDVPQSGEPVAPIAAEVLENPLVGVDAQKTPIISIVKTSLSLKVVLGPRWRRRFPFDSHPQSETRRRETW